VVDHVLRVFFRQAFDLVVEREQLARFGAVHFDGLALALHLCHVDFAFALGCQVSARAHGQGGGDHSRETGEQHIMAGLRRIAQGCAGDARHNAEDRAQSVVHAVDGVADPRAGLLSPFVPLGQ
jgi:hypothetical protein